MSRKFFNKEFKLEAVKLVTERGMSSAQAARDLDSGANNEPMFRGRETLVLWLVGRIY